MNRITKLFSEKKKNILSVYFTAGFPELNSTSVVIEELNKSGVNMIEIGFPFSDPLADGPVIQKSSEIALRNGMNLDILFQQLKGVRKNNGLSEMPFILMGYLNPVLQFGIENFCKKCHEAGVDGAIIPDLPLEEYREKYREIFEKYKLKNIFLVTPQTSSARIRLIDEISDGFIYAVSSASTTGKNLSLKEETRKYFKRLKAMGLKNRVVIGFGISDKQTFRTACNYAHGAIIGSAFIMAMEKEGSLKENIRMFVQEILK